jgi:succinate dehydrogenase / fumarate reductase flavoprotein subunit
LSDGYFVLPATVPNYIASNHLEAVDTTHAAFAEARAAVTERLQKLLSINGKRTPDSFHKELGTLMWDNCGMARSAESLGLALKRIPELREEFWSDLRMVGTGEELNQSLEKANRISDFLELGELMCVDALQRSESCGGHFRLESQTPDGEAKRDDENFAYVSAWEWTGVGQAPVLHKEALTFEYVHLTQRSYK